MSEEELLPVGTRIRFTQELISPACGDHPELVYAYRGELGQVTGHGTKEGYWVKSDQWPHSFGASPEEIEVVKEASK